MEPFFIVVILHLYKQNKNMQYIEVNFTCNPLNEIITDILSAELGAVDFESMVETATGLNAYIPEDKFNEATIQTLLSNFPLDVEITFSYKKMENKNWNEEWEKNYFSPVYIADNCVVKSSFHKDVDNKEYTIVINPKMAFGTGHHQTTILMMQEILKADFNNKKVLDMGCGTAILAILASMRGAKEVTAIDIDDWCYDNAMENTKLNNIANVQVKVGDASLLGDETFDVIIANINRNILMNDMHRYVKVLNSNGVLYMSGFYTEDIPVLEAEAKKHNLVLKHTANRDNWAGVMFEFA